jgi:hypothetical protein
VPLLQLIPAGLEVTDPAVPAIVTLTLNCAIRFTVAVAFDVPMVTLQGVDVQAPLHPPRRELPVVVAAIVIVAPSGSATAQVPAVAPAVSVQLMAVLAPVEVMVPEPPPEPWMVRRCVAVKVAVTFIEPVTDGIEQVPVPLQSPEKPANTLGRVTVSAAAVTLSAVPASTVRVQEAAQGAAVPMSTVPAPVPANVTLTSQVLMKVAVAVVSAPSVKVQGDDVHAPLHEPKREAESARAVSVT